MMMKRKSILWSLMILTVILGWNCSGMKSSKSSEPKFEGKIVYQVDYDLPPEQQQYAAMLPDKEVVYVQNGKTRMERNVSMGANLTMLNDTEKDSSVMLLSGAGLGKKIRVATPNSSDEDTTKPDIEYKEETKTIAGKECKKAIVTIKTRKGKLEVPVFYTPDIPGKPYKQFEHIDGFPLEFESSANGMKVTKKAKEIKEQSVPDSLFNRSPKGYQNMSQKELQKMFQNMRR